MHTEEKIIIAFLYKRSGKNELTAPELYLPLSLELGWFSSQQAQNFVQHALHHKLIHKKKTMLTPTFDINTITIPTGFKPTKHTYEPPQKKQPTTKKTEDKNILETIIQHITQTTGQNTQNIQQQIQQKQHEKNIHPEIAALLIAHEHNINITELIEHTETQLLKEKTK